MSYQIKKNKLRSETYEDNRNVLSWRNEPTTIINMKTKRSLDFKEHEPWFKNCLDSPGLKIINFHAAHMAFNTPKFEFRCKIKDTLSSES